MGYYTMFEFENTPQRVVDRLKEVSGYSFQDTCKWYDHEKHIAQVSREFPHVLITVYGEGEESGDLWKLYALNGEIQRYAATIIYPDHTFNVPQLETFIVKVTVLGSEFTIPVILPVGSSVKAQEAAALEVVKKSLSQ